MKLSVSFILCGALIYATICCVNVAAEETMPHNIKLPCLVQYLKIKGTLEKDFPSANVNETVCRLSMTNAERYVRIDVKDKIERNLPGDVDCIMREYEKRETLDLILAIGIVTDGGSLTPTEKNANSVRLHNELKKQIKATANECGIDEELFLAVVVKAFF